MMTESKQPELTPVQASFAAHLRAFHDTLPSEEQTILEQIFAQPDVQGFDLTRPEIAPFIVRAFFLEKPSGALGN